jgi:hypothetical protein
MSRLGTVGITATLLLVGCVGYRVPPATSSAPRNTLPPQEKRQAQASGAQKISAEPYDYGYRPVILIVAANAHRNALAMNTALGHTVAACVDETPEERLACEAYARKVVTDLYWPDRMPPEAAGGPLD